MSIQTAQTTPGAFYFARSFAVFWTGQTISNLGDGAFTIALAWQVLTMTHSGLVMGTFSPWAHYRKRERRALGLQPRDAWPFLSRGWKDGLGQHAWDVSRA
jgi:hypothetical protein